MTIGVTRLCTDLVQYLRDEKGRQILALSRTMVPGRVVSCLMLPLLCHLHSSSSISHTPVIAFYFILYSVFPLDQIEHSLVPSMAINDSFLQRHDNITFNRHSWYSVRNVLDHEEKLPSQMYVLCLVLDVPENTSKGKKVLPGQVHQLPIMLRHRIREERVAPEFRASVIPVYRDEQDVTFQEEAGASWH